MKITLGKPSVIVQGVTHEEDDWGSYQFPRIYFDGSKLISSVHIGVDTWSTLNDTARHWYTSTNLGESWEEADFSVSLDTALALPNGDKIIFPQTQAINVFELDTPVMQLNDLLPTDKKQKASNGSMPCITGEWRNPMSPVKHSFQLYDYELLSDEINQSRFFEIKRIKAGEKEAVYERAEIKNYPHMPFSVVRMDNSATGSRPNAFISRVRLSPDGTLYMSRFSGFGDLEGKNGTYYPYASVCIFTSEDNGHSWSFKSKVRYEPDPELYEYAYMDGGFNDSDFIFQPDGSIVMLMRCNDVCHGSLNWTPIYYTRSVDMGKTWSKPTIFDKAGIFPKMCRLDCGVTLAIYGRPGIFVRATDDDHGIVWDTPFEIMTPSDRSHLRNTPVARPNFHEYAGSCCNSDIVPVSENQAVIIYSDFYYPDKKGVKRKSILSRLLTIEK